MTEKKQIAQNDTLQYQKFPNDEASARKWLNDKKLSYSFLLNREPGDLTKLFKLAKLKMIEMREWAESHQSVNELRHCHLKTAIDYDQTTARMLLPSKVT
jgi:hypothetical protein